MTTITKTTVEVYKIRGLPHSGWADIAIDAAEEHGRITIASDYGSWQYFWSHCGCPFKKFLSELEIGYVAGKFGADRWFDHEGTAKQFKVDIIERRRADYVSKENARKAFNEIAYVEPCSREPEFRVELERSCPNLLDFYEHAPSLYHDIDPWFRNFWKNCWPVFLDHLTMEAVHEQT